MYPIFDVYEWARAISALPNKKVYATTFNVGVFKQEGPGTQVLKELNRRKGGLIVGVAPFSSCVKFSRCPHCYKKHKARMEKLVFLKNKYNKIEWHFTTSSHAKYVVCGDFVIGGGRNVSDSDWEDLSFLFKDAKIAQQLMKRWLFISGTDCYDIGSSGPLVFQYPYNGELMADSTSIPDDFKETIMAEKPNTDCAKYWAENA